MPTTDPAVDRYLELLLGCLTRGERFLDQEWWDADRSASGPGGREAVVPTLRDQG